MPTERHTFPSPDPIRLHVRSGRGSVRIVASDVTETTVEVTGRQDRPLVNVEAASDGRTVTISPTRRWLGNAPRLDIVVHLPAGSTLDLDNASATVTTEGRLGDVDLRTASGAVAVEQVDGAAKVRAASGNVRLGMVDGRLRMQSASGDLSVATVGGPCDAGTASGAIDIGWALSDVTAKAASGRITVRDAVTGAVSIQTSSGAVTVGVRKGTLVWLDLATASGRTASDLPMVDGPGDDQAGVLELRVQTASGDITVAPSGSASAGTDDRRQSA